MDILNRKGLQYSNYFDDFFKPDGFAKDYRQILFHPGRVLQTRELVQLQTILNEYSKNHLDVVFKNGSVIQGCYLELSGNEIKIGEGLVYFDGSVYKINQLVLNLDENPDVATEIALNSTCNIHLMVKFNIIKNNNGTGAEQDALLDPAIQYFEDEGTVGADRLKVSFEIALEVNDKWFHVDYSSGVVVTEYSFDYDNNHWFAYSRANIEYVGYDFNLISFEYLNREHKIDSLGEDYSDNVENKIIEGLNILHNNHVDININNNSGVSKPGVINDISYVTIDKGIGQINGESVPNSSNTIFKFNKPEKTPGHNDGVEEETLLYHKKTENVLDGVYFKHYIPRFLQNNVGASPFAFDHPENFKFLEVGRKIAIEKYVTEENKFKTLGTANICHIDNQGYSNANIQYEEVWDKYRYKGFWNEGDDYIHIQGMIEDHGAKIHRLSSDPRTIQVTNGLVDELLRHGTDGGVQAVGQRFPFSGVDVTHSHSEKSGHLSYTICRFDSADLRSAVDAKQVIASSMFIYENTLFYIQDIILEDYEYIPESKPIPCGATEVIFKLINFNIGHLPSGLTALLTTHIPKSYFWNGINLKENVSFDIIRYHVIDTIDTINNTFTIEYNDIYGFSPVTNDWFTWESLGDTSETAEDFIIFTSPWEDMCGYETIIRNADIENMQSKFMWSKPMVLYIFKYVMFFNGYMRRLVQDNLDLDTPSIETTSGDPIDSDATFYEYVHIITSRPTSELNVQMGDLVINTDGEGLIIENIVPETTYRLRVLWSGTGADLHTFIASPWLFYTNSTEIVGSSVVADDLFWRIKTISTDVVGAPPNSDLSEYTNNDTSYGSYSTSYPNLQDYYITYHTSEYNKVFVCDIQLENYVDINDILNNEDGSMRVVFLDNDDNKNYGHVIEKGLTFKKTKEVITNHVDGTLNDFNDLTIPFVEDDLNDYSLYTLYNWETDVSDSPGGTPNWTIEANTHVKHNFSHDDKILGCFQAFGETAKDASVFLKIRGTEMPIMNEDFEIINPNQPHMGHVYVVEYGCDNSPIDMSYYIKHQNSLTPWHGMVSGDLGMYIKYHSDSQYVTEITFNHFSGGMGSYLNDVDREFNIVNDKNEIYDVYKGLGMRYFFKCDLAKDVLELDGGAGNVRSRKYSANVYSDRISNTSNRDSVNKKKINVGKMRFRVVAVNTDTSTITVDYNDNNPFTDNIIISIPWEDISAGDNFTCNGGSFDVTSVALGAGEITIETFTVPINPGDFIEFDIQSDIEAYITDHDIKVCYIASYNIKTSEVSIDYFLINPEGEMSTNTFEVFEDVDDFYASGFHRLYLLSAEAEPGDITTHPNTFKWLPYDNGYTFEWDYYIVSSLVPSPTITMGNQKLLCTVVTPNEELKLEDGDPLTVTLYKEVEKTGTFKGTPVNAGIWIKNVKHADSYHPFMRIRENLTEMHGKPLPYTHYHLRRPGDNPELKDVETYAEVTADYNYILPDIAHFYLSRNGIVEYMYDIPQLYHTIRPVYIPNKLYIGSTPIPPIEPISDTAFLGLGYQLFNVNAELDNQLKHKDSRGEIKTNKNMISLQSIYNNERRDIHFSTGKKFVWWEKGRGVIRPKVRTTDMPMGSRGELSSEEVFTVGNWIELKGTDTYFQTTINSGDTIGIYNPSNDKSPTDIVGFNPDETMIVSTVVDNDTLILMSPLLTKTTISILSSRFILPLNFIHKNKFYPNNNTESYFYGMDYFIRREQDINFVQYLMNTREYSIFNIIQNKYDNYDEDYTILNMPDNKLEFSNNVFVFNKGQRIDFRKPNVNIFEQELSPHMKWDTTTFTFSLSGDFKEYNNGMVTLAPVDSFNIVNTMDYSSGSIEFESNYDLNDIEYTFDSGIDYAMYDCFCSNIEGAFVLNIDENRIKWDLSITNHYFEMTKTFPGMGEVDYDYHVTNRVIGLNSFVKNMLKQAISTELKGSFDKIKLKYSKNEKWDGVSSICLSDIADHIVENNLVSEYSDTTSFLEGSFSDFGNALAYNFNGMYQTGIISTDIQIDGSNLVTTGDTLQKISKTLKINDKFNQKSKDYDYIFNQIHNVTYFDEMVLDNSIVGENIYDVFDKYIKPENWVAVLPTVYQTYEFKKNHILDKITFSLSAEGIPSTKYSGTIAVVFGFIIDDEVTKAGMVQTKLIHIDLNQTSGGDLMSMGYDWDKNNITIQLDVPIYIPKDKEFFIGFIKTPPIAGQNDCQFRYLQNGQYDSESDVQYAYPAHINGHMTLKGVSYVDRFLKIDLGINQYNRDTSFIIETSIGSLSDYASKLMILTDNIQPDGSYITYQYKTDNTWLNVEADMIKSLPISQQDIQLRVIIHNSDNMVTPIFRKHIVVKSQHVIRDGVDDDSIQNISYSQLRVICPPFIWRNWSGNGEITYFPIGIKVKDIKNKRHLYNKNYGRIQDILYHEFTQDIVEELPEEPLPPF